MTADELDADLQARLALEWAAMCARVIADEDLLRQTDLALIRPYYAQAFAAGAQWASEQYAAIFRELT